MTKLQLNEQQRVFSAAVLDASLPAPAGLVGPDGEHSTRRFNVYRNNVVVGLIATLQDAYPATRRIVGDEFFKAMAAAFAVKHPPASPMMLEYGAGFAGFIAQFEPASTLPYLPDVARLERAWAEAYHAPEATPFSPASLASVAPEKFAQVKFALHPSLRIVRSMFPVLTIWNMNIGDAKIEPIDMATAEVALIIRPHAEVELRYISASTAEFITALAFNHTVGEAFTTASTSNPGFDLTTALSGLFEIGACAGWHLDHQHTDDNNGTQQ